MSKGERLLSGSGLIIPALLLVQVILASPIAEAADVTVRSGDTLWSIAKQTRSSDSVTIEQQVSAILALNSHAFVEGDNDRLLSGSTLTIPVPSQTKSTGQDLAPKAMHQAGSTGPTEPDGRGGTTSHTTVTILRGVSVQESKVKH